MKRRTKIAWIIALAASILALGVAAKFVLFPGVAFDQSKWNLNPGDPPHWRRPMADRLVARRTLHGLTPLEVEQLLGPPHGPARGFDSDLLYYLGPERGFISIDSEWLALWLDQSGQVGRAEILHD